MESHQKSATEWLQFCWDFVKPRWNSFATFFSCLQQCKNFFLFVICAACNFFFQQALAGIFFQNHHPPPPLSRVKWSALMLCLYWFNINLSLAIHARQRDSVRTVCRDGRGVQVTRGQFWQHMCSWWIRKSWMWSILVETLTVCFCQWLQRFTKMEWRSQQCAGHLKWRLAPLATTSCTDSFKD